MLGTLVLWADVQEVLGVRGGEDVRGFEARQSVSWPSWLASGGSISPSCRCWRLSRADRRRPSPARNKDARRIIRRVFIADLWHPGGRLHGRRGSIIPIGCALFKG